MSAPRAGGARVPRPWLEEDRSKHVLETTGHDVASTFLCEAKRGLDAASTYVREVDLGSASCMGHLYLFILLSMSPIVLLWVFDHRARAKLRQTFPHAV